MVAMLRKKLFERLYGITEQYECVVDAITKTWGLDIKEQY